MLGDRTLPPVRRASARCLRPNRRFDGVLRESAAISGEKRREAKRSEGVGGASATVSPLTRSVCFRGLGRAFALAPLGAAPRSSGTARAVLRECSGLVGPGSHREEGALYRRLLLA